MVTGAVARQITSGADIPFSQDGPAYGDDITRASDSSFRLASPGVYMVQYALSVSGGNQVMLTLNGQELPYTTAGHNGDASQLVGVSLVTVDAENSVLTLRNPPENAETLNLTPNAGGSQPVSAHMVITRLQ